jgi:hypothetical protein
MIHVLRGPFAAITRSRIVLCSTRQGRVASRRRRVPRRFGEAFLRGHGMPRNVEASQSSRDYFGFLAGGRNDRSMMTTAVTGR